MSRIGRKPVLIPSGVEVQIDAGSIRVKGPKGELRQDRIPRVNLQQDKKSITVSPMESAKLSRKDRALWGLARQLLSNMVEGVTKGYDKKLEIEGVGYRAAVEGQDLVLTVGYSKPIRFPIPTGLQIVVEKNLITVSGASKERVGQFAATVKRVRPVEPYKGKGIRYQGQFVRRKLGKKAVVSAGKA
ncbi:MAG: 50S ribosomal protein L6 [Parcubacteria group bacterium]|nr:50S ribosomal protein L6 [Parcubacteria group bacterium]